MNHLKQRGFFSNSNDEQYYNILLKDVYTQSEHIVKTDYVVYNQLNKELSNEYVNGMISQHRQSLINERKRKENVARMKKEEEEVENINIATY
jgi:hemerythrin-like domain-containing protein